MINTPTRRLLIIPAVIAVILGISAVPAGMDQAVPVNSLEKREGRALGSGFLRAETDIADSSLAVRVLFFHYNAYGNPYVQKCRQMVERHIPASVVSEMTEGGADELASALQGQQVCIVPYAAEGQADQLRAYGKILGQFARQGGIVLLTGTFEFDDLQQLGLLDLDYGYYCLDPQVHELQLEHPLFFGTPEIFRSSNYAYPLDISDPAFVSLAEVESRDARGNDVHGMPLLGYKPLGAGKVVYLGLEYYFDEPVCARILANALRWSVQTAPVQNTDMVGLRSGRRSEEWLYAGGERPEKVELRIYPNPYFVKASLEFELTRTTIVSFDMTDEGGRQVASLLPKRTLSSGAYRLELPNVPAGVYFVQCRLGNHTSVRKVVKAAEN